MRSALPPAALALTVVALLTGCVPHDPEVAPPPEPTTEPVFATDEEALEAATDAYAAYLEVFDIIAQDGGKDPERIAPFVTEEWLPRELNGFEAFSEGSRHQEGSSAFADVRLQRIEDSPEYRAVVVYICHDASDVRILDRSGKDVTPDLLGSRWQAEVIFEVNETHQLLLAGSEPWVRGEGC